MLPVIILAAGRGQRMGGDTPKVMHRAAGRPLLGHCLIAAQKAGADDIILVLPPDAHEIEEYAKSVAPESKIAVQQKPAGTADALLAALPMLKQDQHPAVVLYGDTPLILPDTINRLAEKSAKEQAVVFAGFRTANPSGYGRFVLAPDGRLAAITEDDGAADLASADDLCNAGFMAFIPAKHSAAIQSIAADNPKKEKYLTALAAATPCFYLECQEDEAAGANTLAELARLEALAQKRLRAQALENGAHLLAPETCYLSADTMLAAGVVVEPYVVFGAGVNIAAGARIKSFSYIEGAHIGEDAHIGPYARVRPQTHIGARARVGNFVEVKKARIGADAKASHLAYLGDAHIGAGANIGAGTITCNYDGKEKHQTDIGEGAFVGSNASLVAPVRIGKKAHIGAGSTITSDVPANALAIARAQQVHKGKK